MTPLIILNTNLKFIAKALKNAALIEILKIKPISQDDLEIPRSGWKKPAMGATGNNTLPEVCSLFCTFKFIHQYFLGLGVIFSCI